MAAPCTQAGLAQLKHRSPCTCALPPGRLKYLMACGSAVVMPESSWVEFW